MPRVVDLTHPLSPAFPTWDGVPGLALERRAEVATDGYRLHIWHLDEHIGTHLDAPRHYDPLGLDAASIPDEDLILPLVVIDVRARAARDPDHALDLADIAVHESAHGVIPPGACVAMLSGWGARVADAGFRNADASGVMHFPGFSLAAARVLAEVRDAKALAVDTLSLDPGASPDLPVHRFWLPSGRYGLECVANLEQVPARGATIVVGAPKIAGATGGPCRLLALL
ncbi:cyclase family protein [Pinisolibacter sp.]|uniref:cyclase family protein n=1 Tax=Pinisolibacter sp. TaxID=2172024 RepID=UPI002FDD06B5